MSDEIKQNQKAGANSQQTQIQNLTIINGIDEKRAREIFSEMYAVAKTDLSSEAVNTANERIKNFENVLIPKMEKINGALNAFADPSFQVLLAKANKSAACSNQDSDYELLSQLLIHRVEKKDSRKDKAGINRAVEIVDQITEEALNALTVFFAIGQYNPNASTLTQGLQILDNLYNKLPISDLPSNNDWIEELDILDAVRFSTLTKLKKLEQYWSEKYEGFISAGIKVGTENFKKVMTEIEKTSIPASILKPNILLEDYFLLPVINKYAINDLQFINQNGAITQLIPLSEEQKECLRNAYDLYDKDIKVRNKVKENFSKELENYNNIRIAKEFWNRIPYAINVTSVGRVLAHANAKRFDSTLPDFN